MTRTPVLAAAWVLTIAPAARALDLYRLTQRKQPNIHVGGVALRPGYRLTQGYDSNIYLAPKGSPEARGSWITSNKLSLEASLPRNPTVDLVAAYEAEAEKYWTDSARNDAISQSARLDFTGRGAHGLTLRAGDRFVSTRDQANAELTTRDLRWMNTVDGGLDYGTERGRLTAGVDGRHVIHKYLRPEIGRVLNRYEQRAGVNLGYRLRTQTKVYLSYQRGVTHYTAHRELPDPDKNSKSHEVGLGVDGGLTSQLSGRLETGLVHRRYDEAQPGVSDRDTRDVTASARLAYKASKRTEATFALTRGLEESISTTSRFYVSSAASLEVRHRLPRRVSVAGEAAYIVDAYPGSDALGGRRDDIYQGGARVRYDIQLWLSTGLSYLYRRRESTFPADFNYVDHRTAWDVAVTF